MLKTQSAYVERPLMGQTKNIPKILIYARDVVVHGYSALDLSTVSPQEKRLCWSKILRKAKRQPFCRVLAFQRTLRLCNTRLH
jgi:hypothetical protein